jgi:hypothetical protein
MESLHKNLFNKNQFKNDLSEYIVIQNSDAFTKLNLMASFDTKMIFLNVEVCQKRIIFQKNNFIYRLELMNKNGCF